MMRRVLDIPAMRSLRIKENRLWMLWSWNLLLLRMSLLKKRTKQICELKSSGLWQMWPPLQLLHPPHYQQVSLTAHRLQHQPQLHLPLLLWTSLRVLSHQQRSLLILNLHRSQLSHPRVTPAVLSQLPTLIALSVPQGAQTHLSIFLHWGQCMPFNWG